VQLSHLPALTLASYSTTSTPAPRRTWADPYLDVGASLFLRLDRRVTPAESTNVIGRMVRGVKPAHAETLPR